MRSDVPRLFPLSAEDLELGELLTAAYGELVARYGADGRSQVKDGARYFVVLDDARRAVGCGAVQAFEPSSEPGPLAKGKAGDCRDRGTAAELRRFFGRRGIAVRLLPVERRPDLR